MRSHVPDGSRGEGPSKEVILTETETDSDSLPSEVSGAVFTQIEAEVRFCSLGLGRIHGCQVGSVLLLLVIS